MLMMNLMMLLLLLLTVNLSCSRVNDRYSANHSSRHYLLLIAAASAVVVILVVVCCITTTATTVATKATMNAAWTCVNWACSVLIWSPLCHWRRCGAMCLLWVLLMHRYGNRGHVTRINNRDGSCRSGIWCYCNSSCWRWIGSGKRLLIILMLLRGCVIRRRSWRRRGWWNGWVWRWIWRCAPLDSFSMLGNLVV